ncbi:hypothetical protein, partial [Brenneria goodwinii]|uniref:hypothetical protein n=1 Tax=Brenneria goodwinii TaxID=1109412 RepID=UPI001EFB158A
SVQRLPNKGFFLVTFLCGLRDSFMRHHTAIFMQPRRTHPTQGSLSGSSPWQGGGRVEVINGDISNFINRLSPVLRATVV